MDDYWDTTYLFFGRYSDNLYILPKEDKLDSENYHAMIDVDNEFGDSSIENIYINPYVTDVAEKAGIEGCYGIACEVVFSDMSHGLFLYDAGNVITMIRKDVPSGVVNGSLFPILAAPNRCESAIILPKEYWSIDFSNWKGFL